MFKDTPAYSGFSVSDAAQARQFYGETLGMEIAYVPDMEEYGILELHISGSRNILLYQKSDHAPATYTILNFPVDNIDSAVDELVAKGVEIIHYNNPETPQDEKGILRGLSANMGPDIAWFTDPAGNTLAVMQNK